MLLSDDDVSDLPLSRHSHKNRKKIVKIPNQSLKQRFGCECYILEVTPESRSEKFRREEQGRKKS